MADTQLIARQLLSDLKRDFGLTNEQAAGVVGNLMHESGGFQTLQEVNPTVPGSAGGFGFAQWTGDRRKSFDSFVEKQGLDRNSYAANYGFLKHELENDPYERRQFNTVKKAATAAEAARLVSENFLRPGIPHNASRVRYAEQVLPFADMPVPPGELPEVASLQDTRRPALPPVPATPSPQISALRGSSSQRLNYGQGPEGVGLMPAFQGVERFANGGSYGAKNYGIEPRTRSSAEINSTIAGLSRPRTAGNAGDSLAMRPVQGGRQQAPMFDAAYDERVGAMRSTRQPIDSQGMATGSSRAPAPVPASPYDRVTARLNNLPPAAPVPASPYDRVTARLNNLPPVPAPSGASPTTRTVQSVPVRGNVPSGGFAGQERAPSVPSALPRLTVEQMYAGIYPEQPGDFLLGGNTPNLPTIAPPTGISPYQVGQIGVPAMPEIPGTPRTRMASAAPFPMPRPSFMPAVGTSLSVRPMPPMPIARPQIAQQRRAPVPMPLAMRPAQQRAPLRIVVQRDQPQQQQPKPTPQGFTDNGNGSITSNEYGSTYYSRHL